MICEAVATAGRRPFLVGCLERCAAALIDAESSQTDR